MAAAKQKRNTALVKNTSRAVTLKGNAAKSTAVKRNNAKKQAVVAKKTVHSKRRFRRNSGSPSVFAGVFGAFAGATAINLFDLGVNSVFPNISPTIRTGAKFASGFAMLMWGSKISFLRSYAGLIGNSLIFAGALDLVGTYLMPILTDWVNKGVSSVSSLVSPSQVVSTTTTQDTATGQMGTAYQLRNGSRVEVYNNRRPVWQNRFAY